MFPTPPIYARSAMGIDVDLRELEATAQADLARQREMSAVELVDAAIALHHMLNATGQPAISLPLHWTPEGLLVGAQLVAACGREDVLVRIASQIEVACPRAGRRPPICA